MPIRLSPRSSDSEFNRNNNNQEDVWQTNISKKINRAFEVMSKRRKGFPSETRVKKGERIVHGDKELREKLGRNECLRRALSGSVPAAYKDAAAACVIIGSNEAEQILMDALGNSNSQIQHTAACALAAFPSETARELARRWFRQNDGIKDPLGEEVRILDRTAPVFTFEEISHANMDEFFRWSLEKLRKDFKSVL